MVICGGVFIQFIHLPPKRYEGLVGEKGRVELSVDLRLRPVATGEKVVPKPKEYNDDPFRGGSCNL